MRWPSGFYSRFFFFSSRRRHTRCGRDWSSDVCSSDLGHDVPGVFVLVFAIGSALAGLAGVIGGFTLLTQPTLAHAVGSIVFVVVGGLGSLSGALIASLLIGILQTFAVAVDYSLLDLMRPLGMGITRASPLY